MTGESVEFAHKVGATAYHGVTISAQLADIFHIWDTKRLKGFSIRKMWWLSAPDTIKVRHNVDVLVIVADQPKTESAARFPPPLNLDHPEGLVIKVFHWRFNMVFLRIFLVWRSTFVLDKIPPSRSNDNIWCELKSLTFTGRQSVAKWWLWKGHRRVSDAPSSIQYSNNACLVYRWWSEVPSTPWTSKDY